jgi:aspartate aminotransferase-like enzyme
VPPNKRDDECVHALGKGQIERKFNPPLRTLLGPGPSPVNPSVLQSLSLPVIGHLDPVFLKIMDESMAMLRELFQTKNRLALPMSGTGSAGMETCFVNLIEPGDSVLIGVNGVFGTRMVDVAQRCSRRIHFGSRWMRLGADLCRVLSGTAAKVPDREHRPL